MALDTTNLKERNGTVLYFLYTSVTSQQDFARTADAIKASYPGAQIYSLDVKSADGEKVRDFYDISPDQLPAALIVRNDDQLAASYSSTAIPSAEQLAYEPKSIG